MQLFPGLNIAERVAQFNKLAAPYGLRFCDYTVAANSRLALEAAEFARTQGKFHDFHEKVFFAYFTECRDIGQMAVLEEAAIKSGMDPQAMKSAVENGEYAGELEKARNLAAHYSITAVPTFIVNDSERIVGVPDANAFREALKRHA